MARPEVIATATVREGNKAVLLVVDVQVGVMRESWEAARIVKNMSRAVERARAQNVSVIWVPHAGRDLAYGSAEWQWVPEATPAEGSRFAGAVHRRTLDRTGEAV